MPRPATFSYEVGDFYLAGLKSFEDAKLGVMLTVEREIWRAAASEREREWQRWLEERHFGHQAWDETLDDTVEELVAAPASKREELVEKLKMMTVERGCTEAEAASAKVLLAKLLQAECA